MTRSEMTRPAAQRIAVVTGAASGIGAATAVALAARGAAVVLGYLPSDPHRPQPVLETITAAGGLAFAYPVDVADAGSVSEFVAACTGRYGPPDIAVANAGVVHRGPSAQLDSAAWHAVLDVDLLGVQHLFAASVTSMCAAGWGRLLATSSVSGYRFGWAERAAYCAAKAGVVGLVKAYAVEYARWGITVNAVAPGLIETPQSLDSERSLGAAGIAAAVRSIPVGRVGVPGDVAAVFGFLADESAGYVTGQTIIVDGGQGSVEAG